MEKISYYSNCFSNNHKKMFISKFLINFYSINDYIVINGFMTNDIINFDLSFFPSKLNIDSKLGSKVCISLLKDGICKKKINVPNSNADTVVNKENITIYMNGTLLKNESYQQKNTEDNFFFEFDIDKLFEIIKFKLELMKKCFSNKFHNLILYRPYQFEVLCCFCSYKNLFRDNIYDETCTQCGKNVSICNEKYIQTKQERYTFILEALNSLEYVQLPYLSTNH